MEFMQAVRQQLAAHPSVQPQDVFKLCYQAARGAEHLLTDPAAAREYLLREFAATPADADCPLYEWLSPQMVRVNLAAWKARALPPEWLFGMFADTSRLPAAEADRLPQYLQQAGELAVQAGQFPRQQWQTALETYRAAGMPPVRHSEAYRAAEAPAYRIVSSRYLRLLPVLEGIAARQAETPAPVFVVAIDGRAASGKTTMAQQLARILDADTVHLDDFFLPPAMRTAERLAQPGGNVHHERFAAEVLPHLGQPQPFAYRRFDCGVMDYAGERQVGTAAYRVVEGSYSHHPAFGRYAHLTVFSSVEPEEQLRRITVRNGAEMAETFRTRWIPMEEAYFAAFDTAAAADVRV